MLAIPLKSSATVSLAGPLRVYISSEYSKEEGEAADGDLKVLERMRTMSLQARAATETSVQTLQTYYTQLSHVEGLFPVSPDGIRLMFTWHDAFRPTKKSTEIDFKFERAGILFNIGSVKSNIAASADRFQAEGLKVACKEFQVAAGVFKYLRENLVPQLNCLLPSDLTTEGLNMIENIMLAQAQACFCERAIADRAKTNMKASLLARLAQQAATYYMAALRFAESAAMVAAGLDASWPATLRFQHDMYTATAQFHQSEAAKEAALEAGTGYGEEITRLRIANMLIDRVMETASRMRMGPAIVTKADQLKSKIVKNRALAEKDNNAIYLETVPPEGAIKPIPVANMVKYIDFEPEAMTQAQPLFAGMLPKPVKEALRHYEKQAGEVASAAENECKEASKAARQQLAAVGLPGSLESHDSPGGLPESTWKKMQALREKGSTPEDLLGQSSELQTLSEKVADIFLKIEKCMKDEEEKDGAFRAKYGEAWEKVGVSSSSLFQDCWKELQHFQTLYSEAHRSDEFLLSRLHDPEFDAAAKLLASSRQDLNTLLAKPRTATNAPSVDTNGLRSSMLELASLLQERDGIVAKIKEEADKNKNQVKDKLLSSEGARDMIVQAAVDQLTAIRQGVTASIQKQQPILTRILAENDKFKAARQADRKTLERDETIQQIDSGVVRCHELHAQLTEGKEFYTSVSKRLQQLLLIVEDKVYGQDLQRKDFEIDLSQSQQRWQQESADSEAARKLFDQLNMGQPPQQQQQQPSAPGGSSAPPPSYSAAVPQQPPRPPYPGTSGGGGSVPPAYASGHQQQPGGGGGGYAPPQSYGYPGAGQPMYYQGPPPPQSYGAPPPPSYHQVASPHAPPPPQRHGGDYMGPPPSYMDPRVQQAHPGHAPPPPPPQEQQQQAATSEAGKVRQLMDMGFKEADARRALAANGGDFNAALTSLLSP